MKQDVITPERLQNARILVVDDVEINRILLMRSLCSRGYHNVIAADGGLHALQLTRDLKPDLVILDLVMPGTDGFSYCETIRRDPAFDTMPIVVQSMLEETDDKLKAFQLGASDYICKPIDPDELGARTQVHLMTKMMIDDLHDYRLRISSEMEAARAMQNRLLPDSQHMGMCERIFDMKIAAHFETSSTLGGDSWGMYPLSDKKLALHLYDFSGHGISAAMHIFRMHTIMQECRHASGDPGIFLQLLNRHLHPLLERNEFATMFYGVLDTEANCLLYATAATPSPMIISRGEPEPVTLSGRGYPLGVIANASYETRHTPFLPDDLLLLFSDCLFESEDTSGKFISGQQIEECVSLAAKDTANPAQKTIDALVALFRAHHTSHIPDDLTINTYWRCALTP